MTSPVKQPNGHAVFPVAQAFARDWGIEELIVATGDYTMKRIIMHPHKEGGLQYHHKKDETAYILKGSALVSYDNGDGYLTQRAVYRGDAVRFPQGAVHKMKAFHEGCEYIEASTPYLNDRCHVEHLYGLPKETGGLPSTKPEDVVRIPKKAGLWKRALKWYADAF